MCANGETLESAHHRIREIDDNTQLVVLLLAQWLKAAQRLVRLPGSISRREVLITRSDKPQVIRARR